VPNLIKCFGDIHFLNGVQILLFADDLKIFKEITSSSDIYTLQVALDNLFQWCSLHMLSLNIKKCHSISFHRTNITIPSSYVINNTPLVKLTSVKDLGVILDDHLNFDLHIAHIVSKAYKNLGFVLRNTRDFKNIYSLKLLYTTLVRPILEYCSPLWSPYQQGRINSLEKIQKCFLRRISYVLRLPESHYDSLVTNLGLSTLQGRRLFHDIFLVYKLINNIIDAPVLLSLIDFHVPSRVTRSSQLFHISHCNSLFLQKSTFPRVLELSNALASDLDFFAESKRKFITILRERIQAHLGLISA